MPPGDRVHDELVRCTWEIEVTLTGLDDVTMQTIHTLLANGDLLLDLTKFDVLVPDVRASVAA